ncbi:hypothetical protein [Streptomyces sp. Go-475]|uniref:hypothetical protein n=1 Tax=Streptomyces sp. Go-475 TaxID=2072505 RepID=UPI000DF07950|nr:hypothetical protein [Streptomyces sp. Go-475]AXE89560.1 hypothetical protein C1703_31525 [Streptomyces sp. Go-475]
MVQLPPVPPGREFHAPNRFEMSLEDVGVQGEIPREINGIFLVGADELVPAAVGGAL